MDTSTPAGDGIINLSLSILPAAPPHTYLAAEPMATELEALCEQVRRAL